MSGTRSPFRRARAISRSAILVSHGQPSEPELAEAELRAFRSRVARCLPGWTVLSATMAKPGAIAAALQQSGPEPLVYPVFMTDGWFTRTALRERFAGTAVRFLPPLGVDASLPALAARRLAEEMDRRDWRPAETCLIVAAHGSGRSANSARDTRAFTEALQALSGFGETRIGFIEEPPALTDVLADAGEKAICLPFFAARREHVLDDLPAAFDSADFRGLRLDPLGLDPSVPMMIAGALSAAAAERVPA